MAKKKSVHTPPLSQDVITKFKEVVDAVLAMEEAFIEKDDFEGSIDLLQQLNGSVLDEHFDRFAQIIDAANDPDMCCPK
jgi:hypothetical protein